MKVSVFILLGLFLTGCHASHMLSAKKTQPQMSPAEQWASLALNSYDYEIQQRCYCLPEHTRSMRVSVRNGRIHKAVYLDNNVEVKPDIMESLRTIDQWFDYISDQKGKSLHVFNVQYHNDQGYPTKIETDIHSRVADDEVTVLIGNLNVLTSPGK